MLIGGAHCAAFDADATGPRGDVARPVSGLLPGSRNQAAMFAPQDGLGWVEVKPTKRLEVVDAVTVECWFQPSLIPQQQGKFLLVRYGTNSIEHAEPYALSME